MRVLEAYVDGSYMLEYPNSFGVGIVYLEDGEMIGTIKKKITDSELAKMRNVAGEIYAAATAMMVATKSGYDKLIIYHDYEGISKWCTGMWKARKDATKRYRRAYQKYCKQIDIKFVKVEAHTGDIYNEKADELSKRALLENNIAQ